VYVLPQNRNAVSNTDGQKNHAAAAARLVHGPMSISALNCKAGVVRAAFIARPTRNYAKFGLLQTLQK
jgi:hypothetical protein